MNRSLPPIERNSSAMNRSLPPNERDSSAMNRLRSPIGSSAMMKRREWARLIRIVARELCRVAHASAA
jgi:hypothetical protein